MRMKMMMRRQRRKRKRTGAVRRLTGIVFSVDHP
jgi:hypothetical protein